MNEGKLSGLDHARPLWWSFQSAAFREILSACGCSPSLFSATGTAAREAWRQLLFGVIQPLGRLIEAELSAKLEATISFDFSELRASDLQGRARAFQRVL